MESNASIRIVDLFQDEQRFSIILSLETHRTVFSRLGCVAIDSLWIPCAVQYIPSIKKNAANESQEHTDMDGRQFQDALMSHALANALGVTRSNSVLFAALDFNTIDKAESVVLEFAGQYDEDWIVCEAMNKNWLVFVCKLMGNVVGSDTPVSIDWNDRIYKFRVAEMHPSNPRFVLVCHTTRIVFRRNVQKSLSSINLDLVRSTLPGLSPAFCRLHNQLDKMLMKHRKYQAILLSGPPGCGKSRLVNHLGEMCGIRCVPINLDLFISSQPGYFEFMLHDVFVKRRPMQPCVFVVDNIDDFLVTGSKHVVSFLNGLLLDSRDQSTTQNDNPVIIIGVTSDPLRVDSILGDHSILWEHVSMPQLLPSDRVAILSHFFSKLDPPTLAEERLVQLAHISKSHSLSDIIAAVRQAIQDTQFSSNAMEISKAYECWIQTTPPSNLRSVAISILPNYRLSDVHGLTDTIHLLRELVVAPFEMTESVKGIEPPKGVLIEGPSGSGKTMLACALVNELSLPCIYIDGPSIRSKIVGESEKKIANLFHRARSAAPCIILMDQVELMLPKRESGSMSSEGTSSRIVTSFLIELDGISKHSAPICLLATTRSRELIDSAILRPGRIDAHISLTLPNQEQRRQVLEGMLTGMPNRVSQGVIAKLVDQTHGRSVADLQNLCRGAAMKAIRVGADVIQDMYFENII